MRPSPSLFPYFRLSVCGADVWDWSRDSYHYARRQYNLVADPLLRYQHLNAFDAAVNALEAEHHWLCAPQVRLPPSSGRHPSVRACLSVYV
jgi:hypothetical protein